MAIYLVTVRRRSSISVIELCGIGSEDEELSTCQIGACWNGVIDSVGKDTVTDIDRIRAGVLHFHELKFAAFDCSSAERESELLPPLEFVPCSGSIHDFSDS